MGMIKLPGESVEFFAENYNEIFTSGNLAEGNWNKKVAEWACSFTSASHAVATNSNGAGILALLHVLRTFNGKKTIFILKYIISQYIPYHTTNQLDMKKLI